MSAGSRHILLAVAAMLAVAVLATCLMPSSSADQDLADQYPDADFIISSSGSSVLIMERTETEEGDTWTARTVSSGSSLDLADLSESDGGLYVVMTGGSVGTLTLIWADTDDVDTPVDVRFLMLGGEVDELYVLDLSSSVESSITDSYTLMFSPLGSVVLDLREGDIGDLVVTDDMVAGDSLSIDIGSGMTIDRVFTSGKNGRYGSVHLSLTGGTVGYMANQKSVVGEIGYRLESGTVEYFCVGADTQYGTVTYLRDLNTFYTQGDVTVYIDGTVSIRMAIIGAGVFDTPSVLWNGDTATTPVAKNIQIYVYASGVSITPDRCFMTSNRTQSTAYQFSSYSLGSTPRARTVTTECGLSTIGSARVQLYGGDGVWESATDVTLLTGYELFVDTLQGTDRGAEFTIPSGSVFTVQAGSRLVTSGHLVVVGSLVVEGTVLNTGLIEKRDGGTYSGNDPEGGGYLAYCISVNPSDGRIDVMASDDDTVVLRTDSTVYISRITVLLMNGDMEVVISAPDTMYVGGDVFMVALRPTDYGDATAYDLEIFGIDSSVLPSMEMTVTVPMPGSEGTYYVYLLTDDGQYEEMEITEMAYGEVTFVAVGTGTYIVTDVPPEGVTDSGENVLNILLAAAIAVVGTIVVYTILRRD